MLKASLEFSFMWKGDWPFNQNIFIQTFPFTVVTGAVEYCSLIVILVYIFGINLS